MIRDEIVTVSNGTEENFGDVLRIAFEYMFIYRYRFGPELNPGSKSLTGGSTRQRAMPANHSPDGPNLRLRNRLPMKAAGPARLARIQVDGSGTTLNA